MSDVEYPEDRARRDRIFADQPAEIAQMLRAVAVSDLSAWESAFLANVTRIWHTGGDLTPRQLATLRTLYDAR